MLERASLVMFMDSLHVMLTSKSTPMLIMVELFDASLHRLQLDMATRSIGLTLRDIITGTCFGCDLI